MSVISSSNITRMRLHTKYRPTVLISLQKPPDTTDTDNAIRDIFQHKPAYENGIWYWWISCHGKIHRNSIYGEPVEDLLKMVKSDAWVWTLFYYICDNYHQWNDFAIWWVAQCTPPRIYISVDKIVHVKETGSFLKINNVIPRSKAMVYEGFESLGVCAGRAIRMGSYGLQYVSNDPNVFEEINDDQNVIIFDTPEEARCFYIRNASKKIFLGYLNRATYGKITVGGKAGKKRHKEPIGDAQMVWNNYLAQILGTNNIKFAMKSGHVKWTNTRSEAKIIFDLNDTCEKKDKKYIYFMEQMDFDLNLDTNFCNVNEVMLKEQIKKVGKEKKTVIEGLQYLREIKND